jgi:hypothetical protein
LKKVILSDKKFKELTKEKNKYFCDPKNLNHYLFRVGDELYKFDANFLYNLKYGFKMNVDPRQIEMLCDKQKYISKTKLPKGIVIYNDICLGVIYDFFEGYSSFLDLHLEEFNLIFSNIRSAIDKNIELLENDIYNVDFTSRNILYKNSNVELIDLDGRYIRNSESSTIRSVYCYFLESIKSIFLEKMYGKCSLEEYSEFVREIGYLCDSRKMGANPSFDYPYDVVDEIEKSRILRI